MMALPRLTLLFAVLLSGSVRAEPAAPEPPGYRTSEYRSPVPATVNGKAGLSTDQAATLWRDHAADFIDTLPQPPKPAGLPEGTILHRKSRNDIPASVWLPDTGYGELPPTMETYFENNLRDVTHGDRSRRLVFYCLANCWMSWNAAKHAVSLGYTQADWYPDGTDGWAKRDLPLEPRDPVPRPPQ